MLIVAGSCSRLVSPPVGPARDESVAATGGTSGSAVAGCYILQDGPWLRDSLLQRFEPTSAIPRDFQLDTMPIRGWDGLQTAGRPLLAVRALRQGTASTLFTYWQRDQAGSDSIRIATPLPSGGASLHVLAVAGGLTGQLTTFTDAIPPDGVIEASAPVFLARVSCP